MLNNSIITKALKLKVTHQQRIENWAQQQRQYRQDALVTQWQRNLGIGDFQKKLTGTEWDNYKQYRKTQRQTQRLQAQLARLERKALFTDDAKS